MKKLRNKKGSDRKTGIYSGLKVLLIVFGATLLLRGFLFTSCYIPSSGMENSLFPGDHVVVNKWAYGLRLPLSSLFGYYRIAAKPVKTGNIIVFNNPHNTSYGGKQLEEGALLIGRCIATPGDTLFTDSLFTRVIAPEAVNPDKKRLYQYPVSQEEEIRQLLLRSGVENKLMGYNDSVNIRSLSPFELYLLEEGMEGRSRIEPLTDVGQERLYPFIVPGKGKTIRIDKHNIRLLRNTILLHERRDVEIVNDVLMIDNRQVTHYTFTKDYYWSASNNSVNFADSRLFGLVPDTHLIGKATFVWFSKEREKGLFKGYHPDRFFKSVN